MKKHVLIFIMIIAAAALFVAFSFLPTSTAENTTKQSPIETKSQAESFLIENGMILINKKLPSFTLFSSSTDAGSSDQDISISSETKAAIIHLWAMWCGPCKKELPDLNTAMPLFRDNNVDVYCVVSGTDTKSDHTASGIKKYFMESNLSELPIHIDTRRALINYLQVISYPTTYLVKDGKLVAYFKQPISWNEKLTNAIIVFLTK